jgi:hypothetical protein
MKKIWKFTLDLANGVEHTLEIPRGSFRYLKDQTYVMREDLEEGVMPKIDTWWEVDTSQPTVEIKLQLIGTGFDIPEGAYYLGTAFPMSGLVLHLYELV